MNGKPGAGAAANSFAAQLAPQLYLCHQRRGGTREQTLTISEEGVWLLDPQLIIRDYVLRITAQLPMDGLLF